MSFIRLEKEDVTITAQSIISPAWGENKPKLESFFSSSVQSGSESGPYFLDIYSEAQASPPTGSVEFSIAHAFSGSALNPKKAVWQQYTTLLYGSDKEKAKEDLTENFYIVNVSRAKYKEKLEVRGFELDLEAAGASGSLRVSNPTTFEIVDAGRKFNLKDTTLEDTPGDLPNAGFLFPDVGIAAIKSGSFPTDPLGTTGFLNQLNEAKNFTLSSEETITSNLVFARVRNSELNYSSNPSFVDDNGRIIVDRLVDAPQVFPTTVGLYNDSNELLAVAKLSRPLIKDFNKEALLRVKLDY